MGNHVVSCLHVYCIFHRNVPDPCRPSFFLVKRTMSPTLTHNKLYLLDHDELLTPVKKIKIDQLVIKLNNSENTSKKNSNVFGH